MDGNAKNDLERVSEKAVSISSRISKYFGKLFAKISLAGNKYIQKHYSSSLKALKRDGQTRELSVSSELTKEETKELITIAREANILLGVKKMDINGEVGRNNSLHQQEKLAKNEIKFKIWNERRKQCKSIPILRAIATKRADYFKQKSIKDNEKNKDERYIVLCNKRNRPFLTEELEKLAKKRLEKVATEGIDINKDGIIDDKDYEPIISMDVNITPDKLNKIDTDYGSCRVQDYQKNYCTQIISKAEYCEIREQLFELKSHGAIVINDNEVQIAINSDDLEEYKRIAPLDKKIKEFGEAGAREIRGESNINNIIQLQIQSEKEFDIFRDKYKNKDFVAEHNPNGTITAWVSEKVTEQLVNDSKKKSSTEDLLKEANEFTQEHDSKEIDIKIDLEEEQELAR